MDKGYPTFFQDSFNPTVSVWVSIAETATLLKLLQFYRNNK